MTKMKLPHASVDPAVTAGRARLPGRAFASVALALVFVASCATVAVALGFPIPVTVAVAGLTAAGAGFAAHRTVGSVLAGLILLVARPYTSGDHLRVWSSDLDDVVEAEVVHVGVLRTTLADDRGVHVVPNRELLRETSKQA
jgi:small-conductance mechanosensitive channel